MEFLTGYLHDFLLPILAAFCVAFVWLYVLPSLWLATRIRGFSRRLRAITQSEEPITSQPKDRKLGHLWSEYCETLHAQKSVGEYGLESVSRYRATAPAAFFFNVNTVVDGRISVEFFKHLPGLLTGLGIIGTFNGLIKGLSVANVNGGINTQALIASVSNAFEFSALAIIAAMIVTFFEKFLYAWLHRLTDQLCHDIDRLYHAGLGEEYLEQLVRASVETATSTQHLRDSLVGELTIILERLAEKQIEVSNRQSDALRASLQQPMEAVARGIGEFGHAQKEAIGTGFQDQMAVFANKLDELLGSQVSQARELQRETMHALERAAAQFDGLAQKVGSAGETAASAMAGQLQQALDGMAERQARMTETMRTFIDEMREGAGQSQAEVQRHLTGLLQGVGHQMSEIMSGLQRDALATGETARSHQQQLSIESQRTIHDLVEVVRNQTEAMGAAASDMRSAVADLGDAAARSLNAAGIGAEKMTTAANEFTRTGATFSEMFQKATLLSGDMMQTAEALRSGSADMARIIADYREARNEFQAIVGTLGETVSTAKRDASMTSELVRRLEQAAEKLQQAQGQADAYLAQLNNVLAEAHTEFRDHMINTVRDVNTQFHQHVTSSTSSLASIIGYLDEALDRIPARKQ